jgi:hypothetical protein
MNGNYFRAAPTFLCQKQDHTVLLPQRSTVSSVASAAATCFFGRDNRGTSSNSASLGGAGRESVADRVEADACGLPSDLDTGGPGPSPCCGVCRYVIEYRITPHSTMTSEAPLTGVKHCAGCVWQNA